jgi:hypothetical protein
MPNYGTISKDPNPDPVLSIVRIADNWYRVTTTRGEAIMSRDGLNSSGISWKVLVED